MQEATRRDEIIPLLNKMSRRQAASAFSAERARGLRRQLGLSQSDIASALGCHQSFLSRCERGLRRPTADLAVRWGALLIQLQSGLGGRAAP